jgi:hypothetical protein
MVNTNVLSQRHSKTDVLTHLVYYFEEMLPCLDNYISYGHQVICSSQEHQAMMYDIIETVRASFLWQMARLLPLVLNCHLS